MGPLFENPTRLTGGTWDDDSGRKVQRVFRPCTSISLDAAYRAGRRERSPDPHVGIKSRGDPNTKTAPRFWCWPVPSDWPVCFVIAIQASTGHARLASLHHHLIRPHRGVSSGPVLADSSPPLPRIRNQICSPFPHCRHLPVILRRICHFVFSSSTTTTRDLTRNSHTPPDAPHVTRAATHPVLFVVGSGPRIGKVSPLARATNYQLSASQALFFSPRPPSQ